jgi:hypothetical protein
VDRSLALLKEGPMSIANHAVRYWRWVVLCVFGALMTASGCTIQLAPSYDPTLLDGIRTVNANIMKLYATTGMGVDKSTFPSRIDQYNAIIGAVDALALQSQTRPVPDDAIRQQVDAKIEQWTKANVNVRPSTAAGDDALRKAAAECAAVRKVPPAPNLTLPATALPTGSNQYVPASASALKQVSRGITLLRDTDCAHGLNNLEVVVNRNYTQYFISEALFYESALQR